MHVFLVVASHNGSEGDRGRIGRGRTQVPRFPYRSHKEHTQPPLKVGSVRCDTAAAVAAASWRGGPLYCAGSILARLPPSTGRVERCSKGHPKHTTHTHETWQGKHNCRRRRRRRAPKHRWPCSPPGQPRGAVGGWAPASNLPAPCWPRRTKGRRSNCKSVVMV